MMNGKLSCGVLMSLACMTLGQGLSSCVFSVRGHTTEGNDRHRDGGESAEDPKQARRMRKVEEAELKLALARRAADDGLVEARQDLVEARHAWEEARLALEHFQYRAKPQRIAGRQLGVDRARFEVANDRVADMLRSLRCPAITHALSVEGGPFGAVFLGLTRF